MYKCINSEKHENYIYYLKSIILCGKIKLGEKNGKI